MKQLIAKLHWLLIFIFLGSSIIAVWIDEKVTPLSYYMSIQLMVYIALILSITKAAYIEGKMDADLYPRPINHIKSSVWRIFLFAGLFGILNMWEVFGWVKGICIIIGTMFTFSFAFSIRYNLCRKLPISYVGSKSLYDNEIGQAKWMIELVATLLTLFLI